MNAGEFDSRTIIPVAGGKGGVGKSLGLDVDFFGCLFRDPEARRTVGAGKPLLLQAPESILGEGVVQLADRLVRLWETPIPDSRQRLVRSAEKDYLGCQPL